jgi:hypothetical protein
MTTSSTAKGRHHGRRITPALETDTSPIYMSGYVVCPNLHAAAALSNRLYFVRLNVRRDPNCAGSLAKVNLEKWCILLRRGCQSRPMATSVRPCSCCVYPCQHTVRDVNPLVRILTGSPSLHARSRVSPVSLSLLGGVRA